MAQFQFHYLMITSITTITTEFHYYIITYYSHYIHYVLPYLEMCACAHTHALPLSQWHPPNATCLTTASASTIDGPAETHYEPGAAGLLR